MVKKNSNRQLPMPADSLACVVTLGIGFIGRVGGGLRAVRLRRISANRPTKKEGVYEEVTARAIKRVIARQLDALMQNQGLTKSTLAKRMKTSRAQLDRVLDPDNESVTLATLARAAQAVGRNLRMELV